MNKGLILWVALGIGVILIYAAYKNEHIKDIIGNVLNASGSATKTQ